MTHVSNITLRNNSGSKPKDALISQFVVRLPEFDSIMQALMESMKKNTPLNFLIVGQRGYGKTTLLHRVKYALEDTENFEHTLPVMLAEEQYSICNLADLWEKIIEYCGDYHGWQELVHVMQSQPTTDLTEERLRNIILDRLSARNERMVLFLENFNSFLRKIGDEKTAFNRLLKSSPQITLIASTTLLSDQYVDLSKPEYAYFSKVILGNLTTDECIKLLVSYGEHTGQEAAITYILKEHTNRVESMRRLTGGVPRTISYMFDIFLDNKGGRAIKDLYQLVDTLTLLYKSELDQLSPQQQKVIDVIAKNWDAVAVKEISKATRLESKNISTIIANLEKNGFIEKIPTKTKNNLYRVRERFMNIWYLMRYGRRAEKENVKWLVRFYDIWCDEPELTRRIADHIADLKLGQYDPTAAIDMGNTFLSCRKVPEDLKYQLYKETQNALPKKLGQSVRISSKVLYNRINELILEKKGSEALEILETIQDRDMQFYMLSSWTYISLEKYQEALETATKLSELYPTGPVPWVLLGVIYENYLSNSTLAEKHYQAAYELKHPYAAWRLGLIAYYNQDNPVKAIPYLKYAVRKNFTPSYLTLAEIYMFEKDFHKAAAIATKATNAKIPGAHFFLGRVYTEMERFEDAEKAYDLAISLEEWEAAVPLAKVLMRSNVSFNKEKAIRLLEQAIEQNIIKAHEILGRVYSKKIKDNKKAKVVWLEGVKKGDGGSAHQLAHEYMGEQKFAKAVHMYHKAMELGEHDAIFCFADEVFDEKRKDELPGILSLFNKYKVELEDYEPISSLIQARMLLWDGRVDQSVEALYSTYHHINLKTIGKETNEKEEMLASIAGLLSNYFILLLAKEEYALCYKLFEEERDGIDLKSVLKPIYYVLMELLKKEYPMEYMKAGPELKDTILEIHESITALKPIN